MEDEGYQYRQDEAHLRIEDEGNRNVEEKYQNNAQTIQINKNEISINYKLYSKLNKRLVKKIEESASLSANDIYIKILENKQYDDPMTQNVKEKLLEKINNILKYKKSKETSMLYRKQYYRTISCK